MDLIEQITDIVATGKFDYIVIEASGICEPAPIAQTICSIPSLEAKYNRHGLPVLDCIVTVVDALRLKSEFGCGDALTKKDIDEEDIENLIIEQIEFCNIILLNKISEVSAEEAGRIRAIIRAIQPKARIIECDYCDVDLSELINTDMFDFEKVATSAAWVHEVEKAPTEEEEAEARGHHHEHHHEHEHEHHHDHDDEHEHHHDGHEHGHDHHHHHHADEVFTSWGVETAHKYTAEELQQILEELGGSEKYGIILRAKGIVPGTDGNWMQFDFVPEEYEVRGGSPDYTGRLCVIGSKLNEDVLKELFHVV